MIRFAALTRTRRHRSISPIPDRTVHVTTVVTSIVLPSQQNPFSWRFRHLLCCACGCLPVQHSRVTATSSSSQPLKPETSESHNDELGLS